MKLDLNEKTVPVQLFDDIGAKDFIDAVKSEDAYALIEVKGVPPLYKGKLSGNLILEIAVALVDDGDLQFTSTYIVKQKMNPFILSEIESTQEYFDNGTPFKEILDNIAYLIGNRKVFSFYNEYYESLIEQEMSKEEISRFHRLRILDASLIYSLAFGKSAKEFQEEALRSSNNKQIFKELIMAKEAVAKLNLSIENEQIKSAFTHSDYFLTPKVLSDMNTLKNTLAKTDFIIKKSEITDECPYLVIMKPNFSMIKRLLLWPFSSKISSFLQKTNVIILPSPESEYYDSFRIDMDTSKMLLSSLEKYFESYGILTLFED